ncbi:hypothetical protein ACFE04_029256 [Oxalis oulophora]
MRIMIIPLLPLNTLMIALRHHPNISTIPPREPWSAAAAAVNTLIAINPSIASHKSPHSSSAQQHSTTTAQQWRQSTTAAPQHNSNTTQHISGGYTQVYKYGNSIMVENIDRTL